MAHDRAADLDWADCPLIAQTVRMEMRGKRYYTVRVKTPSHEVSVYVSPQGRSVRVYLDGALMSEEPVELHKRLAGGY
jgi:hypothetical protein